jgi:hypothetical protein
MPALLQGTWVNPLEARRGVIHGPIPCLTRVQPFSLVRPLSNVQVEMHEMKVLGT